VPMCSKQASRPPTARSGSRITAAPRDRDRRRPRRRTRRRRGSPTSARAPGPLG
jgi:hypothetical protein